MCKTESEREKKMRRRDSQPLPSSSSAAVEVTAVSALSPLIGERKGSISMMKSLRGRGNRASESLATDEFVRYCSDSFSLMNFSQIINSLNIHMPNVFGDNCPSGY